MVDWLVAAITPVFLSFPLVTDYLPSYIVYIYLRCCHVSLPRVTILESPFFHSLPLCVVGSYSSHILLASTSVIVCPRPTPLHYTPILESEYFAIYLPTYLLP